MLARLHSVTLKGVEGVICEVEVDVARGGLEKSIVVGLPDAVVKESVERVRSAIVHCGYRYPTTQSLINLAPADVKKAGPAFDLPIRAGDAHWRGRPGRSRRQGLHRCGGIGPGWASPAGQRCAQHGPDGCGQWLLPDDRPAGQCERGRRREEHRGVWGRLPVTGRGFPVQPTSARHDHHGC